ncbi:MAG: hypothetical protein WDN03_15700 [Rhizomicrobium sp.]
MISPSRVELFGKQSLISFPIRIHPVYIPHAVFLAVIVLASIANAAMQAVDWIVQP